MLYLTGIGLIKFDFPIGLIELCKKSEVYMERYTTHITDNRRDYIEELIGKKIVELHRQDLEEQAGEFVKKAKDKEIVLLVGGDPLAATTHKILLIEAKKYNVKVKIHHGSSMLPALMGESGLDFYRFGQICTISRWTHNYQPVSFYETIKRNFDANLHSIVLLDYDPLKNASLELKEAVKIMYEAEKKYKRGIIKDNTMMFIMHKLAWPEQQHLLTTVKRAGKLNFANGPTALIIPAKMTEVEKEVISSIYAVEGEVELQLK
ncbi:MAG: diphthine synthase [Candidatus Marsarchaeota archaeon]|nr:diphthine synthase [Candidatus Marsarchaeota archaeon]